VNILNGGREWQRKEETRNEAERMKAGLCVLWFRGDASEMDGQINK
jgi:hypothetical protein